MKGCRTNQAQVSQECRPPLLTGLRRTLDDMVDSLVIGVTPGALGGAVSGRDRRSNLSQDFNQRYLFVLLAVEGLGQRLPIDKLRLGFHPQVLAHEVCSKGALRLCQSNLLTVFPVNGAAINVELRTNGRCAGYSAQNAFASRLASRFNCTGRSIDSTLCLLSWSPLTWLNELDRPINFKVS
jgi:hypothetical protein